MPRQEHVLSVFVASPSDVGDERVKLEEVIRELNITWSREFNIRLDLVRWETHAVPGIGVDPQDVINEQIPDDFDLFVGIMWCRYGTPTSRSDSGTMEEFERAKARYDADKSSVKIMIYFKEAPIPPRTLDLAQLAKVNDFRDSLGDEGVLYWNFTSLEQFEKLTRLHLARQLQVWKAQFRQSETSAVQNENSKEPPKETEIESEDDFGILDLVEIFDYQFAELRKITERIGQATEDLGEEMTARTNEMADLQRDSKGTVNNKVAKRLISRTATNMKQYTARMETEIPLFGDALNSGMKAFIRCIPLLIDLEMDEANSEQTNENLEAIVSLREIMNASQEKLTEFRDTIDQLPRLTSELNKAKRATVSVLDELKAEFNNGNTLLHKAETAVRDLLKDDDA